MAFFSFQAGLLTLQNVSDFSFQAGLLSLEFGYFQKFAKYGLFLVSGRVLNFAK